MSNINPPPLLAERMANLPEYMFEKLNVMRQQKRQAGQDLIDMAMGNPKDPTPQPIVDKLTEVVRDPRNHRYSVAAGIYSLRKELSKYYQAQFGVTVHPDSEVICTIGSKEGFSHLCLALLGAGDRAIVPAPSYPIHTYSVILAGSEALRLRVEDDERFLQGLVELCETLRPRPKVLFLNYPHNPTGKCVELAFFDEVVKIAKRFGLIVVHDFAYSRLTFGDFEAPSFLQAKGAMDVGCEFGTMSKAYNMAGWRVGYALGNRDIIGALNRIKGYYDYGIFQAVQIASIIAIRHCQEYVAEQRNAYWKRRDVVLDGLSQAGWQVDAPPGGMFVWARIPESLAGIGSYDFAMELMDKANVVVSPGIGFGDEGEGYVRMALVENEKRLRQGMRNIRAAFSVSPSATPSESPPMKKAL